MARDYGRDDATTAGDDGGLLDDASAAGGAVLAGTGNTAMVDDAASVRLAADAGSGRGQGAPLPAMSTDNTAGTTAAGIGDDGSINRVQEGMHVVDAAGEHVGRVVDLKMGDPGAVTTMGEEPADGGTLLGDVGRELLREGEPDVPEPFRNELIRVGYIKIDAAGWFTGHRYARADQVATVSGDTVTLSVLRDDLPKG